MDSPDGSFFDNLPDIIGSLSTTGAQWYKLVNAPAQTPVPQFGPTSPGAVKAQAAQTGIFGGLGIVGLIVVGVILVLLFRK